MARGLRLIRSGVWYHITARGIERRPLFKDDRDRGHFLELLQAFSERFRGRLLAYVLMENHCHLPSRSIPSASALSVFSVVKNP